MLFGSSITLTKQIKDLDFEQNQIIIRDGKGMESRITMLPASIAEELNLHLHGVKLLHQQDLQKGYGSVYLPFALEKKYPRAKYEWITSYLLFLDKPMKRL